MVETRIIVRRRANDFMPGAVFMEIENAKNVGYAEYLNDVGEAFFTMTQGDPKIPFINDVILREGLHLQVMRGNTQVFGGWLGETDETETDVVFYGYSYAAALFWLHTDWDVEWLGQQINTIVSDSWVRATNTLSYSALRWAGTGTIEAPVTTSGGATPIVLPTYTANYKRTLFVMQELAAMAASDTTNRVVFEITPNGTFNFWKNRGTTRTDQLWEYGGNVVGYRRLRAPMDRRNIILGVGTSPRDIVLRVTSDAIADYTANTRREEAVFYSWVRDPAEIDRVNRLRLARGLRDDNQISLSFLPGRVTPARATGASYALADYVPVKIDNGITQVDTNMLVTGQQVVLARGIEHVRVIVQDSL